MKPKEKTRNSNASAHHAVATASSHQSRASNEVASRKHGGIRFKARRSAEGPLPAEAGIDYVGLWEGSRNEN